MGGKGEGATIPRQARLLSRFSRNEQRLPLGKQIFTQTRGLHRRAEPRFVRRINGQAGYGLAEGTYVRHVRPSQAILQSRQRMPASFRYLANSGNG